LPFNPLIAYRCLLYQYKLDVQFGNNFADNSHNSVFLNRQGQGRSFIKSCENSHCYEKVWNAKGKGFVIFYISTLSVKRYLDISLHQGIQLIAERARLFACGQKLFSEIFYVALQPLFDNFFFKRKRYKHTCWKAG
jgi:hypothetical protein